MQRCIAAVRVLLSFLVLSQVIGAACAGQETAPDNGISVAQPKIWRYERVYPLLDGMLRDIELISLSPITSLDPNQANLQYLDFFRTLLNVQADYNQGIGVKNADQAAQLKQNQDLRAAQNQYAQDLIKQRNAATEQLTEAEQRQADAQKNLDEAATTDAKTAAQTDLDARAAEVKALQSRISDLSTQITSATQGQNNAPTFADVVTPQTSPTAMPAFLDGVPDNIKNAMLNNVNKADLPASKQIENYLTLLNERLAKQLSVIADDASRNNYELFLMQIDVGIFAAKNRKDDVARIEFLLNQAPCSGEHAAYAYSMIPGSSSYNIEEYIGKSQHVGLIGAFNLLMGLGASGEYQRQRDQLHNGLVQSVYSSGFMNGRCSFGWIYGPSPFDRLLSPGLRTAYALVAVPNDVETLKISSISSWQDTHGRSKDSLNTSFAVQVPRFGPPKPSQGFLNALRVKRIAYQTTSASDATTNTILIALEDPADPDLTVTVGGNLLKRFRDSRGQAVRLTKDATSPPRGELEVDTYGQDTWILVNPTTLMLQIGRPTAGAQFPVIRLSDSSSPAKEITNLLSDTSEVDVNEWHFTGIPPRSAFLPLFSNAPMSIDSSIKASVEDRIDTDHTRGIVRVRVAFRPQSGLDIRDGAKLSDSAQVVLVDPVNGTEAALRCTSKDPDLLCDAPLKLCTGSCLPDNFPADLNIFVRDRLTAADGKTPKEVLGSTTFASGKVLPRFDDSYSSVSLSPQLRSWIIEVKGTSLTQYISVDSHVKELDYCDIPSGVQLSPTRDSITIGVPTAAYECLSRRTDDFSTFHLSYVVPNTVLSTRILSLTPSSNTNNDSSIWIANIPNLRWAIESQYSGLSLSRFGADATFTLRGTLMPAHSITRIQLIKGPSFPVSAVDDHTVQFDVSESILQKDQPWYVVLQVGDAVLNGTDNAQTPHTLCFNFHKNDASGCGFGQDGSAPKPPDSSQQSDKPVQPAGGEPVRPNSSGAHVAGGKSPAPADKATGPVGGKPRPAQTPPSPKAS